METSIRWKKSISPYAQPILSCLPPNSQPINKLQTYKTTKSFVKGTEEDFKTNGNGTAYTNVSIIEETEQDRQTLNNRFYEIKEGEALERNERGEIIRRTPLKYPRAYAKIKEKPINV